MPVTKSKICSILLPLLLLFLPGCGLTERQTTHDAGSVAAIPYTLEGESEQWRATYRVDADVETEAAFYKKALHEAEKNLGKDSPTYQRMEQALPAYAGTLYLEYLGDKANLDDMQSYFLTFASGTEWEQMVTMERQDSFTGLQDSLNGKMPLGRKIFAADASQTGSIPPIGRTYTLKVEVSGADGLSETLDMAAQTD
ncbi:hypothetical protein [Clostridium sp. D33t1_170424_F3]|uniref:hypothetical protein n=1 Tax=Clostridium sp. D33t1_170424_F3 TaxID=2787099 RepID=UPI0018A9F15D|nr:hypothetical protein [Clostridium sp. D33t1_170424_F3]